MPFKFTDFKANFKAKLPTDHVICRELCLMSGGQKSGPAIREVDKEKKYAESEQAYGEVEKKGEKAA